MFVCSDVRVSMCAFMGVLKCHEVLTCLWMFVEVITDRNVSDNVSTQVIANVKEMHNNTQLVVNHVNQHLNNILSGSAIGVVSACQFVRLLLEVCSAWHYVWKFYLISY